MMMGRMIVVPPPPPRPQHPRAPRPPHARLLPRLTCTPSRTAAWPGRPCGVGGDVAAGRRSPALPPGVREVEGGGILNKIITSCSIEMTQTTSHSSGGRRTPFLDTGRHLSPYLCKRYRLDEVRSFLRKRLTCLVRSRGMSKTSYVDVCRLILECPTIRTYEPRLFVIGGTCATRYIVPTHHIVQRRNGTRNIDEWPTTLI